jgi:hypothetical protein
MPSNTHNDLKVRGPPGWLGGRPGTRGARARLDGRRS